MNEYITHNFDELPSRRYSSALKMRRELEKCFYPGFWTMDSNGNLIGKGAKYHYRFEIIAKKDSKFDFIPYKKNISTYKETKIGVHTLKSADIKFIKKARITFINWVIENAS